MLRALTNSARKRAATLCLLALGFFYAQATTLAGAVASGVCCDKDHCPIAAHHHPRPQAKSPATDCGHDMATMEHGSKDGQQDAVHMSGCSMSCCQTQSAVAFHAPNYLVPPAFVVNHSVHQIPLLLKPELQVGLLTATPPVPPPKLAKQTA